MVNIVMENGAEEFMLGMMNCLYDEPIVGRVVEETSRLAGRPEF